MIRFILTCIIVVGFLILSIPILIVEWIVGKFNSNLKAVSSLRIVQAVFRLCLKVAGVKVTVIWRRECSKRHPGSLYRKPQKLLRHLIDLYPLRTSHGLCG